MEYFNCMYTTSILDGYNVSNNDDIQVLFRVLVINTEQTTLNKFLFVRLQSFQSVWKLQ